MIVVLELATWALLGGLIYLELQAAITGDVRAMIAWAIAAGGTVIAIGVARQVR